MSDARVNTFRSELQVSPVASIVALAGVSQLLIVIGALLPHRPRGEAALDLVVPVLALALRSSDPKSVEEDPKSRAKLRLLPLILDSLPASEEPTVGDCLK